MRRRQCFSSNRFLVRCTIYYLCFLHSRDCHPTISCIPLYWYIILGLFVSISSDQISSFCIKSSTLTNLLVSFSGNFLASMVAVLDFFATGTDLEARLVASAVVTACLGGGALLLAQRDTVHGISHLGHHLFVDHGFDIWDSRNHGNGNSDSEFGQSLVVFGYVCCILAHTAVADERFCRASFALAVCSMLPRATALDEGG